MATQLGVSQSTYRDWEYGRKIKGEPYPQMAQILGVSLNELFNIQEPEANLQIATIREVAKKLREIQLICESFL